MFNLIDSMSVAHKSYKHAAAKFYNVLAFLMTENQNEHVNDKVKELLEIVNQTHPLVSVQTYKNEDLETIEEQNTSDLINMEVMSTNIIFLN